MNKPKILILAVIFLVCIILILWVDFNLFPYIQTNFINTNRINGIVETLSLSYITSLIFYLIVVFSKQYRDVKNSTPNIQGKLQTIRTRADSLKEQLEKIDSTKFQNEIPTKEELDAKLKTIDLTSDAGQKRLYPFSWEQLFKEHVNDTRTIIDRILILLPYLDTKLIHILNKLYDCLFFNTATSIAPMKLINQKLKELSGSRAPNFAIVYSEMIIEYLNIVKELESYIKDKRKSAHNKPAARNAG